jgi:EpsI family protein
MPSMSRFKSEGLFVAIALILVVQTAAPRFISVSESNFPLPSLNSLPYQLGNWKASDGQQLDRAVTEYLRPDEYLVRDYVDQSAGATVSMFLAYFKTMQNSWGPHSPSVCLPASGWQVRSSKVLSIDISAPANSFPVNEYILEKSDQHILVLYWYQNGRSVWADDLDSKQRQLMDLVKHRRSDICLVRLIMPLRGTNAQDEEKILLGFSKSIFPSLAERFASIN